MKPGDIVRLKEGAAMHGAAYQYDLRGRVGTIIEWNESPTHTTYNNEGEVVNIEFGDGWIQWSGIEGLDIVFEEDLELIE